MQDKGTIWNNNFQGQGKVYVEFHKSCAVTGNGANCKLVEPIVFNAFFHLAWKWDGSEKQLEQGNQQELGQKPDLIFTHNEVEGGPIKTEEPFVTLHFTGTECIATTSEATGFESAQLYPTQVETWVKEAAFVFTTGKHKQHYWTGVKQEGVETELKAFGLGANFAFEDQVFGFAAANGEPVEIAVFEN